MSDATPGAGQLDEGGNRTIVVMGVSGVGKSHLARRLADSLGYDFIESDTLHSAEDVALMSSGVALTDKERLPWLRLVGEAMLQSARDHRGSVTACSALKRSYRDLLREYVPDAFFIFLDASPSVIRARMQARQHSFMPVSLLESQLATLEPLDPDERGVRVDADGTRDEIFTAAQAALAT